MRLSDILVTEEAQEGKVIRPRAASNSKRPPGPRYQCQRGNLYCLTDEVGRSVFHLAVLYTLADLTAEYEFES